MSEVSSFTWMRHREHGGVAQISTAALVPFEALGWEVCDEESALAQLAAEAVAVDVVEGAEFDAEAETAVDVESETQPKTEPEADEEVDDSSSEPSPPATPHADAPSFEVDTAGSATTTEKE